MKSPRSIFPVAALAVALAGCSQEIPPAHKGRLFDKTGGLALWIGGRGFEGPILGPGTHVVGIYPEIRMVECAQRTIKESLNALTADGVQFSLDVYVSYSANCGEELALQTLLDGLAPEGHVAAAAAKDGKSEEATKSSADPNLTITADQVYRIFVRPALGEAVRESVSPYIANDVNAKREEIFGKIKKSFEDILKKAKTQPVTVYNLNLSNLDFPDAMDKANEARAAVAIQKDTSLAEQEKIKVQIETAKLEVIKAEVEAQAKAKKIDVEGAALHRNPEYYIRDVYYYAAEKGGSVMVPQNPNVILQMTPAAKK